MAPEASRAPDLHGLLGPLGLLLLTAVSPAPARETPFQVIQRSLDRDTGRIDLLLSVTAPIPDLAVWTDLEKGAPVPLQVIPESMAGAVAEGVPLRMERGTQLAPGARVHVSAQLAPGLAKQARQLRVVHAPARP